MALFLGFMAMAVGVWTGNHGLASCLTLGVMFASHDRLSVWCLGSGIWYLFTD